MSQLSGTGRRWAWLIVSCIIAGISCRAGIDLTGFLLRQDPPLAIDILFVASMVAVLTLAYAMNALAHRAVYKCTSMSKPRAASKEVGWIELIRVDRRIGRMMVGLATANYVAAVAGLVALIRWGRGHAWASSQFAGLSILGLCLLGSIACVCWQLKTFGRFVRRRVGPTSAPGFGGPELITMLYDRELDCEFASNRRPVS